MTEQLTQPEVDEGDDLEAMLAVPLAASLLASCGSTVDEASREAHLKYAWVVMGDGGKPIARVATDYASCPYITVDGLDTRMTQRAGAGSAALRTTASAPALCAASITKRRSVIRSSGLDGVSIQTSAGGRPSSDVASASASARGSVRSAVTNSNEPFFASALNRRQLPP